MKLKNNDIPLYYQLENKIREKIKQGEYRRGEKIPSERKLSKIYEVSRMTARKALENLVDEGVLEKRERQGTFVSEIDSDIPSLVGIKESIKARGEEPSNKIITKKLINPKDEIKKELSLIEDEQVILIERINFADEIPLGFEQSYIPYPICPQLLEEEVTNESIYQILRENGYTPTKAKDKMKAILGEQRIIELLDIESDQPVLKNIRTTFSKERAIVFSYNYYRGTEFTLERTPFNLRNNN